MLTAGTLQSRQLANTLHRAGIDFDVVSFAYPPPPRRNTSRARQAVRQLTAYLKSVRLLRAIGQWRLPAFPRAVRYVGYCNGERMLDELRRRQPDYILMMGGCILSAAAIATAKVGVLNSHPGLLPWARGMDVMEHSLLRDIPVGATGHYIDVGIDTGPLLLRYLLPVERETTRARLHDQLTTLCTALMFEMVSRVSRGESLVGQVQEEKFPYCKRLTPKESEEAERLAISGKPIELYHKWRNEQTDIPDGSAILRHTTGGDPGTVPDAERLVSRTVRETGAPTRRR
ncbi:MAG: methionyl-tRNA formyltransferase [Gemmatimonadetes bacterium]|nr:methionyl-tRNA formyltransferase [Gemmatimonadota bacterium]